MSQNVENTINLLSETLEANWEPKQMFTTNPMKPYETL